MSAPKFSPIDFCIWLQGCLELGEVQKLSATQTAAIRSKLTEVLGQPSSPDTVETDHGLRVEP